MKFQTLRIARSTAAVCAAVLFASMQMQKVSFKTPAENSKYALQQNVDVGDGLNHIVRIYDVHRAFPTNQPVVAGLKIVEESDRGVADYIDGNGNSTFYSVYTMENGDKFFIRSSLVVQSATGKLTGMSSGVITSGTGKLAGIHGVYRGSVNFDPKTGFNVKSNWNIRRSGSEPSFGRIGTGITFTRELAAACAEFLPAMAAPMLTASGESQKSSEPD
jgi:hypothetical protein